MTVVKSSTSLKMTELLWILSGVALQDDCQRHFGRLSTLLFTICLTPKT
jgi:hypothetical protein